MCVFNSIYVNKKKTNFSVLITYWIMKKKNEISIKYREYKKCVGVEIVIRFLDQFAIATFNSSKLLTVVNTCSFLMSNK